MLYNISVSKRKKIIISVSVLLSAAVILTACLLLVFLLKPKPAERVFVEAGDYQIFVKTDASEQNHSYRFKFAFGEEEFVVDSQSHILDVTEHVWNGKLKLGTSYRVSVCLVEPSGVLAGNYSRETVLTPRLKLKSPTVTFSEEDVRISWQAVRGADFYNIYYSTQNGLAQEKTASLSFDLSRIIGGKHNIFVTAGSANTFLKESDKSNTITATITHTLSEFTAAYIDQDYVVHITSPEKVPAIVLRDLQSGIDFTIEEFDVIKEGESFVISFSAAGVYSQDKTFTVRPLGDAWNVFNGKATVLEK